MDFQKYIVDVEKYISQEKEVINQALEKALYSVGEYPPEIHEAMRYSVFAGGKRLRPILAIAASKAVGGSSQEVMPFAVAIELIHTYSLIHDDLPCMDDDDYRRGKPTCHKVYGEAIALLAGDALLTYAFEIMSKDSALYAVSPKVRLAVIHEVAQAIGTLGMIGGQVVDILSDNTQDAKLLSYIHSHKTGALLSAAVRAGAIIGGGQEEQVERLTIYGQKLGLAFQITDDILDCVGEGNKLGKNTGSDMKNNKLTYVSVYGVERARELANNAANEGIAVLRDFGSEADILRALARFLVERDC